MHVFRLGFSKRIVFWEKLDQQLCSCWQEAWGIPWRLPATRRYTCDCVSLLIHFCISRVSGEILPHIYASFYVSSHKVAILLGILVNYLIVFNQCSFWSHVFDMTIKLSVNQIFHLPLLPKFITLNGTTVSAQHFVIFTASQWHQQSSCPVMQEIQKY